MKKTEYLQKLKELNACQEAINWSAGFDDAQQAWDACENGAWMLWLVGKLCEDRKLLVLAACQCARLALKYIPENEKRPVTAIEIAEKWARNEEGVTLEHVRLAASASYAAYAASYAAANAARAARAANAAAYAASDAAAYAAYAASYAAANAARAARAANAAADEILKQCADIVRQYYPKNPVLVFEKG
jgi:hypothetical protein